MGNWLSMTPTHTPRVGYLKTETPSWSIKFKRSKESGKMSVMSYTMESSPWCQWMIDLILLWCKNDTLFADLWSMIVPYLNIISWNVQGAGNKGYLNSLKDLIGVHDLAIVVLLETQISGYQADKVCEVIGFDGILHSEAMGFRGGIWVLWRGERVSITEVDVQQQFVSVSVERAGEVAWLFSAIYACPNSASREALWSKLLEFSVDNNLSWLLMGDFNETRSLEERTGNLDALRRRCDWFNHWIEEMGLLDVGFTRQKFTWSRGKDLAIRTCVRLDRGLCNSEWQ
ncbi:hypothetical protein V2J09_000632 [Rumex salicifolius]